MGTGYTRNDTSNNIADGNIIDAADLDGEFDAIQSAFNASTGHTHDGTTAEGAPIEVTGPAQEYVSTATELRPKTNNTYDLGSSSLQWKDLYVDGTANLDTVDIDAGTIDGVTIGGATPAAGTFTTLTATGNVTLGNAATDTVTVTADVASDLIPSADGTYDLGAVGSEWQDLFVDGTANIDSLVADTADINGGTIDGVTIGGSSAGAITGTTITGSSFVTTGDMTFGNNDKAIFGAGSDLQIFSDGTKSYLIESGTGDLEVRATDFVVKNAGNTKIMASFNDGGTAQLRYDNAVKLATANTGVEVTGTVTSDGLTVDTSTLHVDSTNNRVGVGTAAPDDQLQVVGASHLSNIRINGVSITCDSSDNAVAIYGGTGPTTGPGITQYGKDHATIPGDIYYVSFGSGKQVWRSYDGTTNTNLMRLTSDGKLGIGSTSPLDVLHVVGSQTLEGIFSFIRKSNTSSSIILTGGTSNANGANIVLYGETHSTLPNVGVFESDEFIIRAVAGGSININITGLPTSSSGLSAGDIWNDSGTLKII